MSLELDPSYSKINNRDSRLGKRDVEPAARLLMEVAGVKLFRLKSSWLIVRGLGVYRASVSPYVLFIGTKREKRVPTAPIPGVSRLLHRPLIVRAAGVYCY